jgi:hypothetical protein
VPKSFSISALLWLITFAAIYFGCYRLIAIETFFPLAPSRPSLRELLWLNLLRGLMALFPAAYVIHILFSFWLGVRLCREHVSHRQGEEVLDKFLRTMMYTVPSQCIALIFALSLAGFPVQDVLVVLLPWYLLFSIVCIAGLFWCRKHPDTSGSTFASAMSLHWWLSLLLTTLPVCAGIWFLCWLVFMFSYI